jgi:Secretion system C-terminal sorting domain
MKKQTLLLFGILALQFGLKAQTTPYTGGIGSGYYFNLSAPANCDMFYGGIADGAAATLSTLTDCPVFFGGIADGAAANFSTLTLCPSFFGDTADGAAVNFSSLTICSQFLGGAGDGYGMDSSGCFVVLPVKLLSFYGEKETQRNILHWKTETGYDVKEFDVEKSSNGTLFSKIGTVTGSTTTGHSYLFIDNNPFTDISFYRLRITEKNNEVSYSKIIALKGFASTLLTAYPNPNRGAVTIYYYSPKSFIAKMQLYQADGRIVSATAYNFKQGANYILLDMQHLTDGIYFLKIEAHSVKLVLQKN